MDQVASGHVALGTLLSKSSNCFCRRFSRQHFKTIKLLTWKVILSWVRFEIIISFGKGSSSKENLFPIKTRTFVLSRDSDYKKFHLVREMKFNAPENCLKISILVGTDDDQHVSRRAGRDHFTDYSFCLFSEATTPLFLLLLVFVSLLPKQIIVDYFFRFTCPLAMTTDSYLVYLKTDTIKTSTKLLAP